MARGAAGWLGCSALGSVPGERGVVLVAGECRKYRARKIVVIRRDMLRRMEVQPRGVVLLRGPGGVSAARARAGGFSMPVDAVLIPGYMMERLGVSSGGRVRVEPARAREARWVELAPAYHTLAVDPAFERYTKRKLQGAPVVYWDIVAVPVLSYEILLRVTGLEPEGPALIGESTVLSILGRPPEGQARGPGAPG